MSWLNPNLRVQEKHREEVLRLLGIASDDPRAEAAIAAVEDAYRMAASIKDDDIADRPTKEDQRRRRKMIADVHRSSGELLEMLRRMDEPTWFDIEDGAGWSRAELGRLLADLHNGTAQRGHSGRRFQIEDRLLVTELVKVWEGLGGDRPAWRPHGDAGDFGLFVNFVAQHAIRYRNGSLDRSIRDVLEGRKGNGHKRGVIEP